MDRNKVQSIGKSSENGTELERVEIGGENIPKIEVSTINTREASQLCHGIAVSQPTLTI
jgi:hypothetical protein